MSEERPKVVFSHKKIAKADDAYCDAPGKRNREIRIRPGRGPRRELELLIHELSHFKKWHLSEKTIQELGEFVADELWARGYRKVEKK